MGYESGSRANREGGHDWHRRLYESDCEVREPQSYSRIPSGLRKPNAVLADVADCVKFIEQDLFKTDLKEASVVTLYLLPEVNLRLRPKLLRELKPGTRVVSHAFDMGDWKPEQTVQVEGRTIYYWVIPKDATPKN